MTRIRCHQCREFFAKHHPECPQCGAPRRPVNAALESQAWRTNLNRSALHADKHT